MSHAITLSSLAMLKVSIDGGKDYLEYLRPYVLQVLTDAPPERLSDASVALQLRKICGLEIPARTVQVLLQRLAREGFLSKANGIYSVAKELPANDRSAAQADALRHITAVTHALVDFAAEGAKRELTAEDANDCLIAFLSQFSIPCLKSYLRGTALPSINGHSNWQITLVSQFISEFVSNPALFESFMTLVQGHMIANALLCPDLQSVSQSYNDVVFYFDTPLLIQLLGLDGEEEKAAIGEVVGLVQRLNGKIAYFSHTYDELVNAIRSSSEFVDSAKGRGTIVDTARRCGRTKSDLILISAHAADTLAELRIFSIQTPAYRSETFKFEISEEIFGSLLDEEINYYNPRAKDYDIRSVRSIYILRRGNTPFAVEKAGAVLVTNNASFSKAAYEYGKNFEQSREVSTVITDFSLANTAWLKAPQGAPSLPRKEVLAFAYAALKPSTAFWNKVLDEAEKLEAGGKISPRDHQLLRSSHHVQIELMKLTLGEDDALTEESITTTLNRVSSDIRQEESERLQLSQAALAKTQEGLAQETAKNEAIKEKIYWRCDRRAKREAIFLSILIWFSQIFIAVFGVIKIPNNATFGWILLVTAILSGLIRLVGTQWDIKPLKAYPAFVRWRRESLLKRDYLALSITDSRPK